MQGSEETPGKKVDQDRKFHFHPGSGEVRLENQQLLFRITERGIKVWDKHAKKEVLLPWQLLLGWKHKICIA
ncbi:MAG: hypothetical protein GWN58_25710 [Anaerolineae bacterium]|nr:hypothetical protein [Anaerolineae bacterium]